MSAAARKIAQLESRVSALTAMLWIACNKAGGEIHITKEELIDMPRGAQLEQKQTSVGVKVIALDPWKLNVTDAPTEKELLKEFDRPDLDITDDATGSTQTTA